MMRLAFEVISQSETMSAQSRKPRKREHFAHADRGPGSRARMLDPPLMSAKFPLKIFPNLQESMSKTTDLVKKFQLLHDKNFDDV
jgi:hypothetical protein